MSSDVQRVAKVYYAAQDERYRNIVDEMERKRVRCLALDKAPEERLVKKLAQNGFTVTERDDYFDGRWWLVCANIDE